MLLMLLVFVVVNDSMAADDNIYASPATLGLEDDPPETIHWRWSNEEGADALVEMYYDPDDDVYRHDNGERMRVAPNNPSDVTIIWEIPSDDGDSTVIEGRRTDEGVSLTKDDSPIVTSATAQKPDEIENGENGDNGKNGENGDNGNGEPSDCDSKPPIARQACIDARSAEEEADAEADDNGGATDNDGATDYSNARGYYPVEDDDDDVFTNGRQVCDKNVPPGGCMSLDDYYGEDRAREVRSQVRQQRSIQFIEDYYRTPLTQRARDAGRTFDAMADRFNWGWYNDWNENWQGARDAYLDFRYDWLQGKNGFLNWMLGSRERLTAVCFLDGWDMLGLVDHRDADLDAGALCGDACVRLEAVRFDSGINIDGVDTSEENRYIYRLSFLVQPPRCSDSEKDKCGDCSELWKFKVNYYKYDEDSSNQYLGETSIGYNCGVSAMGEQSYIIADVNTKITHFELKFTEGNPRDHLEGFHDSGSGKKIKIPVIVSGDGVDPDTVPGSDDDDGGKGPSSGTGVEMGEPASIN